MLNVAFLRRQAVEDLGARRIAMTAALHANGAFYKVKDGPKERDNMIKSFNEKCDEIVVEIYSSKTRAQIEAAELEDPFLAAINADGTPRMIEAAEERESEK